MEKIFLADTPSEDFFKPLKRKISCVKHKIPDFDTNSTPYFENSARITKKCLGSVTIFQHFFIFANRNQNIIINLFYSL